MFVPAGRILWTVGEVLFRVDKDKVMVSDSKCHRTQAYFGLQARKALASLMWQQ